MSGGVSSQSGRRISVLAVIAFAVLTLVSAEFTVAQVHGVPPSVTSIQFHVPPFLPNIMPSVTSLGPSPFTNHAGPIPAPYGVPRSIYAHGIYRHAYKNYGYGAVYAVPYY